MLLFPLVSWRTLFLFDLIRTIQSTVSPSDFCLIFSTSGWNISKKNHSSMSSTKNMINLQSWGIYKHFLVLCFRENHCLVHFMCVLLQNFSALALYICLFMCVFHISINFFQLEWIISLKLAPMQWIP